MARRFVSIWFRNLATDWFSLGQPHLRNVPFVLRAPSHGRMVIVAANIKAKCKGVQEGMVLADARAFIPDLEVLDNKPDLTVKLLRRLAEWCIRFTPIVAVDPPDGLFFDATGCSHLWGGDGPYLAEIIKRLNDRGYAVGASIADTPGVAWALARFGSGSMVVQGNQQLEALLSLPPEALRLEPMTVERLHKLGLHQIRQFISMPRVSLRRRFGTHMLHQIDKALGAVVEALEPVQPPETYQERLPCMEPILTATGIQIALQELLKTLCRRLQQDQMGLRSAVFKGYRVDGQTVAVKIITNRPTHNVNHLLKLFEIKITTIDPALGIELFILEAPKVEDHLPRQEKMWEGSGGLDDVRVSELIDRLVSKISVKAIQRFVPDERYWPERSYKPASSLLEKPVTEWRKDKLRPLQLLPKPEPIDVTAPIPDYPPMLFRYKGKIHKIVKADGPERIEQEWWLQQGQHRDYYRVEDEEGRRYWLFRLGHYHDKTYQWFLHGFFG